MIDGSILNTHDTRGKKKFTIQSVFILCLFFGWAAHGGIKKKKKLLCHRWMMMMNNHCWYELCGLFALSLFDAAFSQEIDVFIAIMFASMCHQSEEMSLILEKWNTLLIFNVYYTLGRYCIIYSRWSLILLSIETFFSEPTYAYFKKQFINHWNLL